MELKEIIKGRRSVRAYEDRPVSKEVVKELLSLAVHAPTGSNMQPWGFVIVEDKAYMKLWSDRTKEHLLGEMENRPYLKQYKAVLENKDFNIFYNAPCLLLVYGDKASPNYLFDGSLAAQNIMLGAYQMGLGSCWIGFASALGNSPQIKGELGVPDNYNLVAPLVLGYPRGNWSPIQRKEPVILAWKE